MLHLAIFVMAINAISQENQTADLAKLEQQLFQAYKNRAYGEALKITEKMHEIKPDDIDSLYNLAIVHTKLKNEEKAQEWFKKAIEAGGLRSFRKAYYEHYITMLEHEDRDAYQKPGQVMAALAFKPGEQVADIGAGSGYFTLRIAKTVGSSGLVRAIDVEQFLLDHLEKKCGEENVKNVKIQLVQADDPQLTPRSVDTVLLVHTYAFLPNRVEYMTRLKESLKPGGRIVIIEYIPASWEQRPWGPLPHQQVARETADAEMSRAGFFPDKIHDFLPGQYFIEYTVKK